MEPGVRRARVAGARVARLATTGEGGRPHVVPCCFAIADDVLYSAVDDVKPKSTRSLRRLDNIRHRPPVSLVIDHYDEQWPELWWVRLDGVADVFDPGSAIHAAGASLLRAKYEQYADAALDGPMIVVTIERWTSWP